MVWTALSQKAYQDDVSELVRAHPRIFHKSMGTGVSFQFRNKQFSARSRKSRDCAEAYKWYVTQAIPQIDAEIAEKGHLWMETSSFVLERG